MRRPILSLIIALSLFACSDEPRTTAKSPDQILVDSLDKDVDDAHIVGMSKMGRLNRLQDRTEAILDSIGKLPAAAQAKLAAYRKSLDSTLQQLNYADGAMNKWMSEYRMDSVKEDAKKRLSYLTNEKIKVDNVKEAILSSIRKADSLIGSRN